MGRYDKTNMFSDMQAIIATAVSAGIIDLGSDDNYASGTPVPVTIRVTEDFNNLTTLNVEFEESIDEAFTAPISLGSQTVALVDLVAGFNFATRYLPGNTKRYMRLKYTVVGTAPTTGKIFAAPQWGESSQGI